MIASLHDPETQRSSICVFEFLDKCIIRYVQKSVKYYEDLNLLYADGSTSSWTGQISPLFATLVEQWPYVAKSAEESEKLEIAQWLARYVGYSRQLVGDETLLASVRDQLVSHAGDRKCRAVLEKAFKERKKDGFPPDQQISIQHSLPESVIEHPQPTALSADTEDLLRRPQAENDDHPGLRRWMRKDVQEAIDDGDVGELVICICSEHEDIRKQALVNIEKFMAKLEVSTHHIHVCIKGKANLSRHLLMSSGSKYICYWESSSKVQERTSPGRRYHPSWEPLPHVHCLSLRTLRTFCMVRSTGT